MTSPGDGLHVVFGATGAIGSTVVAELLRHGRPVRAVSRGGRAPEGAEGVAADAADPAQAASAAAGAAVVHHCASPPYTQWPELFPELTRSVLAAAESAGAKLVFADNLYSYGPVDGPLREDLPAAAQGRKGRTRTAMAAELLDAHRTGRVRVAIGRASDYYGPRGTHSTAGETLFGRLLAGRKPQWVGSTSQTHTLHHLPDIARGLITLADRPEADGQVWHLPADEALTAQQFTDLAAGAAGRPVPATIAVAGPAVLAVGGLFSPMLRELRETAYQFSAPFVVDSSKFGSAFGPFEPTPHAEAVAATVEWYRSR
ncbi:NAD-dependent epimerase/dehydratase family protein [Streptomyces sp. NPDC051098]|uniref:NAD-dependent epimerase/dehydratase family protein n=1 Tax=Streptomyces sp. NPDC051098 TaxID=3155411 RepID=UPI0034219BCB